MLARHTRARTCDQRARVEWTCPHEVDTKAGLGNEAQRRSFRRLRRPERPDVDVRTCDERSATSDRGRAAADEASFPSSPRSAFVFRLRVRRDERSCDDRTATSGRASTKSARRPVQATKHGEGASGGCAAQNVRTSTFERATSDRRRAIVAAQRPTTLRFLRCLDRPSCFDFVWMFYTVATS